MIIVSNIFLIYFAYRTMIIINQVNMFFWTKIQKSYCLVFFATFSKGNNNL